MHLGDPGKIDALVEDRRRAHALLSKNSRVYGSFLE